MLDCDCNATLALDEMGILQNEHFLQINSPKRFVILCHFVLNEWDFDFIKNRVYQRAWTMQRAIPVFSAKLVQAPRAQKSPKPCQSLGLTLQIDVYDDSMTSSSPFVHPNGSKHQFWANRTLARSNRTLNVQLAKASLRSRDTERYYPRYSYMLPA